MLQRMCDAISHRGPDERGIYHREKNVGLAMCRLKVIDLSGGSQPIYNEDGSIVTVFNGEIYNYRELRESLLALGHRFKSKSDTETIVHAYEQYGEDFLSHLNGMFAIALWDSRKQKLLLARDRLGEKPLYYMKTPSGLTFGSELKTIQCDPEFKGDLAPEALYHYFTLLCVPAPLTIYKAVQKLPPAHYLTYQAGRLSLKRYWDLNYESTTDVDEHDLAQRLLHLMKTSLRNRMISDVPLGAFLSGGIDSSIVVGLMSQIHSQPIKTFSIGFNEKNYSEIPYARVVAKRFNTDHHELVVEPVIHDLLPKLVRHFDEPFGGPSAVPTYLVSELARRHVTVALSGDGGDEVFLGYDSYSAARSRRYRHWIPEVARNAIGGMGQRLPEEALGKRYLQSFGIDDPEYFSIGLSELWKKELFSKDFLRAIPNATTMSVFEPHLRNKRMDAMTTYGYLDTKVYLPENVLVKVDRMSMANSLEARTLFLDHEIVEFAARIPWRLKLRGHTSKYILKKAVAGLLPPEILNRPKKGFALPTAAWLKGPLRDLLRNSIAWAGSEGIFNRAYLAQLVKAHEAGTADHQRVLWALMMFERCHNECARSTAVPAGVHA